MHLDMNTYKELVIAKAWELMKSDLVKSMKANDYDDDLHYGIAKGTAITIDNIISLILYCDFTQYCTSFSSTFRTIGYETIDQTKKRNSAYWFQSKLFRETVELYGHNGQKWASDRAEKGPFFTGLNCVLAIPSFNLRLNSPTSTSKQIEVSIKFAKRSGMIITYVSVYNIHSFLLDIYSRFYI